MPLVKNDAVDEYLDRHPSIVTLLHLSFKGEAILVYMLCGWFSDNHALSLLTIVLLLLLDFWIVKDITGRFMVGLRWWNYVDYDQLRRHSIDSQTANIFWTALVVTPLLWAMALIFALPAFGSHWVHVSLIALVLNVVILQGFVKSEFGPNESIRSVISDYYRKEILRADETLEANPLTDVV